MTMATQEAGRNVEVRRGDASRQPNGSSARRVAPAVDIYEEAEGLVLLADLPGVGTGDVKLDVNKDVLTISARFAAAFPGASSYTELLPAEYFRAFALGEELDPGRITATLRNGVLELRLPKAERARTKTIKIVQG